MRIWVVLALAACPSPGDDVPCGDEVAVGTGVASFTALEDGGELGFVHGNQGGYHLPLAARVCEVDDPGLLQMAAHVVATGEQVSDVTVDRFWLADGDCCFVLVDLVAFLAAPPSDTGTYAYTPFDPASIDGELLEITLTVTDGAGAAHTGSVRVTARQP